MYARKGWVKGVWTGSAPQQAAKALASGALAVMVGDKEFSIKEFVEENTRCMGSVSSKFLNTYYHNGWEVFYNGFHFYASKDGMELMSSDFDAILSKCC